MGKNAKCDEMQHSDSVSKSVHTKNYQIDTFGRHRNFLIRIQNTPVHVET